MPEHTFDIPIPDDMDAPAVRSALAGPVVLEIMARWRSLAQENVGTGDYLAHLTPESALRYPYVGDRWSAAVVNTSESASFLESGRQGFHLASRWGVRGGKWKVGKKGQRYAIVPFRIASPIRGTKGGSTNLRRRRQMPAQVYAQARRLPDRGRLGGQGDLYKQSKSYVYYRQIFDSQPLEHLGQGYTWRAGQFEGMVHTIQPTPGGGHQAEYKTFRTITPESKGWYIPPMRGEHLAQRALHDAEPAIQAILWQAAATDLAAQTLKGTEGL